MKEFGNIVVALEKKIQDLANIFNESNPEGIKRLITQKLELLSFKGKGIKDNEQFGKDVLKLAAYFFIYQLFFYKLNLEVKTERKNPALIKITNIEDLYNNYFGKVVAQNDSVYDLNLLTYIPNNQSAIELINKIIEIIQIIKERNFSRDLIGRFFHQLIPYTIRKQLAAYYTSPSAADLMAGLLIDSYDQTIIDPACGSGTLLVAALDRKKHLYNHQKIVTKKNLPKPHFIDDLTGIDIMPFAATLSKLNLLMQVDSDSMKNIRIGNFNALEMGEDLISYGKSERDFTIEGADVVLMNPPYTAKERLTSQSREKLTNNPLGEICGHLVNLWGYFLALGDKLLKEGGHLGAVIPINFVRGKASKKIREFFLDNYHLKYILKSVSEMGFTEHAQFRDIILIAEKKKPSHVDKTGIVLIKKKSKRLTQQECEEIAVNLRRAVNSQSKVKKNELFDFLLVDDKELRKKNLTEFIWGLQINHIKKSLEFMDLIREKASNRLTRFHPQKLREGFHTSPRGLSQMAFITDPMNGTRISRSFLIHKNDSHREIQFHHKDHAKIYSIERKKVKKALRTITGLNSIDISNLKDYVITSQYDGFEEILEMTNFRDKKGFKWDIVRDKITGKETYVSIFRRFSPYSKNTKLLSFFSEEKFIPSDSMKLFASESRGESLLICLFLNSVLSIIQFLIHKQETTGAFTDIKQEDLINFEIIDFSSLKSEEIKEINKFFMEIKDVIFPPLREQFKHSEGLSFKPRIKLDMRILKLIGLNQKESKYWLSMLYNIIDREISMVKKLK